MPESAFDGQLTRRTAARAASLAIVWAALAGCGAGASSVTPTAALAATAAEQTEFRKLATDWSRASRSARIALEPRIEAFREAHRKSELGRAAEVLLAWVALEKGELAVAGARARRVQAAAGPGSTSDLARTVEGAALRRQGKAAEALELLMPLVGKLVDAYARELLNEEVMESALAAGKWQRALRLMGRRLREAAPEEQASVRARVERGLERVPAAELERLLSRERSIEVALAAEEEVELRRLVAQRLSTVAREKRDTELAQRLLAKVGALLGDQGDAIAELAAGASKARVEARTVGLLLSLRSDETRRRGAEVAAGVAFGLGLPGSAARLVSRDDRGTEGRIDEALASLSADGASIVIAGCDTIEAAAAARFAESKRIPVLLLTAPSLPEEERQGRFSFVVGEDRARLVEALVKGLSARSSTPVGLVTDDAEADAARPDVASMHACNAPGAWWKAGTVGGIVLGAGIACNRDAIAAMGTVKLRYAAGFEASALTLPAGSVVATGGLFPIAAGAPPPALKSWGKTRTSPPSWWAALGHDAAVLAWAGVQGLPVEGTEDPGEVAARRAKAAAELSRAEAELWTTEARGFGGGRALPRTIGVREPPASRAR